MLFYPNKISLFLKLMILFDLKSRTFMLPNGWAFIFQIEFSKADSWQANYVSFSTYDSKPLIGHELFEEGFLFRCFSWVAIGFTQIMIGYFTQWFFWGVLSFWELHGTKVLFCLWIVKDNFCLRVIKFSFITKTTFFLLILIISISPACRFIFCFFPIEYGSWVLLGVRFITFQAFLIGCFTRTQIRFLFCEIIIFLLSVLHFCSFCLYVSAFPILQLPTLMRLPIFVILMG